MNLDYAYCLNKDSCIHRRGCRRWAGNYSYEDYYNLESKPSRITYINDVECIGSEPTPYSMLDRFRLSDEEQQ